MITQNVDTPVAQVISQITQTSEMTDQVPSHYTQMQMNDDEEDQVPSHHTQMQMGDDEEEVTDQMEPIPQEEELNQMTSATMETVQAPPDGTHTAMGDTEEEVTHHITQNNGSIPSYETMTTILPDDMRCIQIQGQYFNFDDHLMTLEESQRCENIAELKQAAQADIPLAEHQQPFSQHDAPISPVQGLIATNPPSGDMDCQSDMLQQAITMAIIKEKPLPEGMPQDQAYVPTLRIPSYIPKLPNFRPIIHSPPSHQDSPFDPDVIPLEGEVHQIYSPFDISPPRPSAPTYDNIRGRSPKITPNSHPHLYQAHQTIPTTPETNSQDCSIHSRIAFQSDVSSTHTSRSSSPLLRPDTPIPPRVHTPFTSETYTRKWIGKEDELSIFRSITGDSGV